MNRDLNRVEFANTLRGLAALAVLISHYCGVFWLRRDAVSSLIVAPELSAATVPTPQIINWINPPNFNWGVYGVALFFLVSGFVIPFSVSKSTFSGFFLNRVFRIYPLYTVGFTLSLISIWTSATYFGALVPFETGEVLIHYLPGVHLLLWSRSIDGIIWTLNIEIFFYCLCLMSVMLFRTNSLRVFLVPATVFLASAILSAELPEWQSSSTFLYLRALSLAFPSPYLIFMFIGTALHFLHIGRLDALRAGVLIGFLFGLHCIAIWLGPYPTNISQVPSYCAAVATFVLAMIFPSIFKSNRATNFFSDISYPLYIIHGVAGYMGLRLLLEIGFPIWIAMVLVVSIIFGLSWLLHIWIELPSRRLGKYLDGQSSAWWGKLKVRPSSEMV